MTRWLSWLWWISSYISEVISIYEKYNEYLLSPTHTNLTPGCLKKGMWLSRSMGRSYDGIGPIPYCQHHGIVIDVENESQQDEVVHVLHFTFGKIQKTTLKVFMDNERICNVYTEFNPNVKEADYSSWDGKYNLVTNNCEHFSSFMINGIAHSKQVELVESIAWNTLWTREPSIPDTFKRTLSARYMC